MPVPLLLETELLVQAWMTAALNHPTSAALLGLQGCITVPEELFLGGFEFCYCLPNCLPLSVFLRSPMAAENFLSDISVPCTFE